MAKDDTWKIENNPPPNPSTGDRLNGLHIKKTADGYEVKVPGANNPLATTNVDQPPFDLTISYGQDTWNLHVVDLPARNDGHGHWRIPPGSGGDPNDGDFKAQAGSGAEGDEGESDGRDADDEGEAASSAYA